VEAARQDEMEQPAGVNEGGGEDGHLRRRHDKMICKNQPAKERQTRGEAPADKWRRLVSRWRRRVERTRGKGGVSRGQEVEAVCQEDKRRRRRDNRGDTTTSWRTRGQWEGRCLQTRGSGLSIG
jgi:hypothetical protein